MALDKDGLAVKRMQSFATVQPGEVTSCVGCHEPRTQTIAPSHSMLALQRPASIPEPIYGCARRLRLPKGHIQPILDTHCVPCHGYEHTKQGGPREGGVLLTGDRGPLFSHSYFTLSARRQLADGRNQPQSNYPPRALGSGGSALLKKIREGHGGVHLDPREEKWVRLWIDTGAPYPGTYGGLGSGMIGGYEENQIDQSDRDWPEMKSAMVVLTSRCVRCHADNLALPASPTDNMGMPPWAINYASPRLRFSRHILYNLSRPEDSLLLLAPLDRDAGGWGLCGAKTNVTNLRAGHVFKTDEDPDYRCLLAAIERTKEELVRIGRFDMPDFRPRRGYIREMRRYGILQDEDGPINPYTLDRAYWESLWWRPAARAQENH